MISWDKPKKIHSTEEHNKMYSSDAEVNGTYVPNMSEEDKLLWKGKLVNKGKDNERIELRKTFEMNHNYAQVLIVVSKNNFAPDQRGVRYASQIPKEIGNIRISSNGKMEMTFEQWNEFTGVMKEAMEIMGIK